MKDLGRFLMIIGLLLAAFGALLWSGIGRSWFGQLPGDIHYTNPKGNFTFYFPIVTCILVSIVLTLILWLFRR